MFTIFCCKLRNLMPMPRRIRTVGKPRKRNFIRDWREFRDLSQDSLAERLNMSKAQLSRIENGKQPWGQDFLEPCADVLKTDVRSLLTRKPTEDDDGLWVIWENATPDERAQITALAKIVTKKAS